jgi:general secretion pathway protein C
LEQVERSQVKIRNRDQSLTTLMLHEQGPISSAGRNRSQADRASTDQGLDSQGTIREVGENRWVVSSSMVESVRDNFATQMRLAEMQPRLVNGKTDGFLVRRIYPRSILAKMGLQRNDVVLDVNNIKLDSPEKAMQVFQQLREARQISIAVERNSQPMSFVYEIE